MSLRQNIQNHWQEITRKREAVAESLNWSVTGRNLIKANIKFANSQPMQKLTFMLADENANTIDRFKISQYFAKAIDNNPKENLPRLCAYLFDLANKSDLKARSDYYNNVRLAIEDLQESVEYAEYINIYLEFKQDNSPDAQLARLVIAKIGSSAEKMMGEYA